MSDRQYRRRLGPARRLIATASLLALAQGAHAEAAAAAAASDAAGDPVSEVVVTAPRQEVKAARGAARRRPT